MAHHRGEDVEKRYVAGFWYEKGQIIDLTQLGLGRWVNLIAEYQVAQAQLDLPALSSCL